MPAGSVTPVRQRKHGPHMTTPPDAGNDPDRPGERRGLESYPEFFAYPIDPDAHETAVIPRVQNDGTPVYQKPYTQPQTPPRNAAERPGTAATAESEAAEGIRPPSAAPDAYPETYIKDKASGYPAPTPHAQNPPPAQHAQAQIPPMRLPEMPPPLVPASHTQVPHAQASHAAAQTPPAPPLYAQTPPAPAQPTLPPPAPYESARPAPAQTPPPHAQTQSAPTLPPPASYASAQTPPPHAAAPHEQVAAADSLASYEPAPQFSAQDPPPFARTESAPTLPPPAAYASAETPPPVPPYAQTPAPAQPTLPPPASYAQAPREPVQTPSVPPRTLPTPPHTPAPPPPPPKPPRPRTPGRRRAKRSLLASLWPFQAFARPAPANSAHIRSRSTTATVWRKLRADRAAVLGGCTVVVLVLLAVFAPVVTGAFGVGPNTLHPELTDATFGPHGSFGGISWAHPLGVDQRMGRDIMARLLFGSRVSLLIAGGATLLSVALGVGLGVVSGYLGGRVDLVVMRVADVFLAFPLMLFALGLTGALSDQAFGLSGNALRIAIMIFVMGFFNWPYIARIVRAEVLSLREREFVDAARAMGASTRWIVWRELMPNLLAPILVYTTLLIPANIIFEAGLSALGIGLDPPAASWGQILTDAVSTVYTDPEYLIVPGMAVFITVLAFNLFGDGLRNATDPTAQ
jgi:peptide/nickel transport system permease protein